MKYWILLLFPLLSGSCASSAPVITPTNHHCQNLKKVNDIDDLLYQMYSNLDSHCLFKMPTEQLEQAWGIRIFDYTKPDTDEELDQLQLKRIQFDETQTQLYLIKTTDYFTNPAFPKGVNQTRFILFQAEKFKKINQSFGGSTEHNQLPTQLPIPNSMISDDETMIKTSLKIRRDKLVLKEVYDEYVNYFWLNSQLDKNKPLLKIYTGENGMVSHIHFLHKAGSPPEVNAFSQPLNID